ncbi:MAG: hypothetical protein JSV49_12545 [Thermoplasmata archaeon]|nr:MAG: hypothetical protein JSV49_12545 [Thermoplasmata archaeon]
MNINIIKKISSSLLIILLIINTIPILSEGASEESESRQDDTTSGVVQSFSATLQIPPGQDFFVYFDQTDMSLEAKPARELPEVCNQAIDTVPDWLRLNLTHKFHQLSYDYMITYANLILNSPDSRYIDEIAFCIAHSAVENLQHDYMFPEIFTHNAELIYQADPYLDYVEISEQDDYTTVIYKDKNQEDVLLPRDLYYWYIVHPKLSDELPTYVDPNYDYTSQPPFSRNYGVPPPEGKFWRDWLFYHNDSAGDYDGPAKSNPLLKDLLSEAITTWEAISACNNWMSNSMAFTSNEERPIQPVRIYRKHIGRCGEYQDMRNAIARAGLIPSTCTLNSAEDHVWNEFWDNRWIHWDGSIDKPNSYDNDVGGYFHKDLSSVWNTRGDSHIWSVTSKYTPVCNFTATVVDSMWLPVDGALVAIETENYYNSDLRTVTTWGTTDYTGQVSFDLGNYRNYWTSARTDSLGDSPPVGTESVITNSEAGVNYSYTFTLPLSAETFKANGIESPNIDDEKYTMEVNYEVVSNILRAENEYTGEHADVFGPSGNIDFFISNSNNFNLYQNGLYFFAYNVRQRSIADKISFVVPPDDGRYYAVFSNAFSQATTKILKVTIDIVSEIKVEITSPEDGAELRLDDDIHISGTAWGPSGVNRVEISYDNQVSWIAASDGAASGSTPYSTWEYYLDTTRMLPGAYTIWAKASQGKSFKLTWINISLIDLTNPTITIDNPKDSSVFGPDEEIKIQGLAYDNVELSRMELVMDSDYSNCVDLLPFLNGDSWEYAIYTRAMNEGEHTITVNANDTSGNPASVSVDFNVKDLIIPEVLINSPNDGLVVRLGESVDISGKALDNNMIEKLELKLGDNSPADITSYLGPDGSWSYRWDTYTSSSPEGLHTIEAKAVDDSDNINSDSINIILDGSAPQALITSPGNNEIFSADGVIPLEGFAHDSYGISRVELIFDSEEPIDITSEVVEDNWYYEYWNFLDLGGGEHTLVLAVTDKAGHTGKASITVIIDELAPLISISATQDVCVIGETIVISGTATDDTGIDKVTLMIGKSDPVDITSSFNNGKWEYTLDTTGMTKGRFIVMVFVTDSVGNTVTDDMKIKLIEGEGVTTEGEDSPPEDQDSVSDFFSNLGIVSYILIGIILLILLGGSYIVLNKKRSYE